MTLDSNMMINRMEIKPFNWREMKKIHQMRIQLLF